MTEKLVNGFSRLDRDKRIDKLSHILSDPVSFKKDLEDLRHPDPVIQSRIESFSENTIGNFPLPYSVAPNFLVNGTYYWIPMVIEESSVVAAASSAAKFWATHGGFTGEVKDVLKKGQVYFSWHSEPGDIFGMFDGLKNYLYKHLEEFTSSMVRRGGGILEINLVPMDHLEEELYCMDFSFRTADSMGANFINTILEESSRLAVKYFDESYCKKQKAFVPLMSILSNYTPSCIVKVEVRTRERLLEEYFNDPGLGDRMLRAFRIAENDINRAVTHNKGIFNGIDAVLTATGNDYRAVEAAAHAYASRKGKYTSLSYAGREEDEIFFGIEMPMSIGTVGGLTSLHPLAVWSLEIMQNPGVEQLMIMVASAGLANNFSAVRSLVSTGIQKGHMKLHLENILNFMGASEEEKEAVHKHFAEKKVSYAEVRNFMENIR